MLLKLSLTEHNSLATIPKSSILKARPSDKTRLTNSIDFVETTLDCVGITHALYGLLDHLIIFSLFHLVKRCQLFIGIDDQDSLLFISSRSAAYHISELGLVDPKSQRIGPGSGAWETFCMGSVCVHLVVVFCCLFHDTPSIASGLEK